METNENININLPIGTFFKLVLGGLFFIAGGYLMVIDSEDTFTDVIAWCSLAFGIVGLIAIFVNAWLRIHHKPMVVISDKELRTFVLTKMRYDTIRFEDVERFHLANIGSIIFINAVLLNGKVKRTNIVSELYGKKQLGGIYNILNDKLEQYRKVTNRR